MKIGQLVAGLFSATMLVLIAGCSDSGGNRFGQPIFVELAESEVTEDIGRIDGKVGFSTAVAADTLIRLSIDPETGDLALPQTEVTVPAGLTEATFALDVIDDDLPEASESFSLRATVASSPAIFASTSITILDDDNLPALEAQAAHWAPTGVFLAAAECGSCHIASRKGDSPAVMRTPETAGELLPSPDGEDMSPFTDWTSSVMANAFIDPYFRAAMAHEAEMFPHLAGFIEDKCLTCHTPMARTHAHETGESLVDGYYRAKQAMTDPHAREGISCTLCHQISDSVLTNEINSGNYEIPYLDPPIIFGPYEDPQGQAMTNQTGFVPQFGEQMTDSRHCASCHELFTPVIDNATDEPNGEVFPEQTPYTEWVHSDFGPSGAQLTTCQDCHMAREGVTDELQTRIAIRPDGTVNTSWPERSPFYSHVFVGGNTWLLDSLEMFREELGRGDINEPGDFAGAAERTRRFLKTAATLTSSDATVANGQLAFRLTVENRSGHKLPTSFPSRRVWVATRVTDATGNSVFSSGFPDSRHWLEMDEVYTSSACMAPKKPTGFDSSNCYSAHVNTVTSADQVPVYEAVLQATTGDITHILLYASNALKDNRIPPRGFGTDPVPDFVEPQGVGEDDLDFNKDNSGRDTISYQLSLPSSAQLPLTVESTLYYQSIRPTFVEVVHGAHPSIEEFRSVAAANPPPAEVLDTISFTVGD